MLHTFATNVHIHILEQISTGIHDVHGTYQQSRTGEQNVVTG